jgi:hypothetical protein
MKKILTITILLLGLSIFKADAQYVRVRPGFSIGITVGSPRVAPFAGAIWIGPEWVWRRGHYVEVPGHWVRPMRHHRVWIPGHWHYSRRGYRWIHGYWR